MEQSIPSKDDSNKCHNVWTLTLTMKATDHLPVSVWEATESELVGGHWYQLTNVSFGIKLTTFANTMVSSYNCDVEINW